LEKIRREIKKFKSDLNQVESREKSILTQLDNTEKSIGLTEKLLSQLNREQIQKDKDIKSIEKSITQLESNLNQLQSNFARRLVYLYKSGTYSDLELLLTSTSFNQAIYRYKYLHLLAEIDRSTSRNIRSNITEIAAKKQKLLAEMKAKEQIIAERRVHQKSLAEQRKQRQVQLESARKDKNNLLAQIKEKEQAATQLSKLIADLEKERERRRIELERQRALSGITADNPFLTNQGKLPWPAQGEVIAKFGIQKHPTLKTITENSGIDIQVKRGTPVMAILDGVVTTITYIRGFGNTIIIDHGSGFYSVYSHVENVRVTENEYITAGLKIAEVGDSGSLSGPLLHFEIWRNKTKLDPEDWLGKKS